MYSIGESTPPAKVMEPLESSEYTGTSTSISSLATQDAYNQAICELFSNIVRGTDVETQITSLLRGDSTRTNKEIHYNTVCNLITCHRQKSNMNNFTLRYLRRCSCAYRFEYLLDIDCEDPASSNIDSLLNFVRYGHCDHVAKWHSLVNLHDRDVVQEETASISLGHLVSAVGNVDLMKCLQQSGYRFNKPTGVWEALPIHIAVLKNQPGVLRFLLSDDCSSEDNSLYL